MISAGIAGIKRSVKACGDQHPATGNVRVRVKVGPDGKVTEVEVKDTPDAALGECVVRETKKAKFVKTQTGGSFSYPFVF